MSHFPFSVLFQINYASLWHHRFEQDKKKKYKQQKKKRNLLLYFGWRSKQQQVFARTLFTKEKGARAQKSHVPLEQPNFQQSGGTGCCTRYSQQLRRAAGFSSMSPDDIASVVCLSLARRQKANVSSPAVVQTRPLYQDPPPWFKGPTLRPSWLNVLQTGIESSNLPLKAAMCKSNVTESAMHLCESEG